MKAKKLSKERMKKYILRRKWQVNTRTDRDPRLSQDKDIFIHKSV